MTTASSRTARAAGNGTPPTRAPRSAKAASGVRGFDRYAAFFKAPPAIVMEWHDDRTPARGWLCVNALRGGAAGGGTRMRPGGTRDEAVFLAKTMQAKFNVCGPRIGGGKSVIDFDVVGAAREANGGKPPTAAQIHAVKHDVLSRWYKHAGPLLKTCYGTGGDVGVDEALDTIPVTKKAIGLLHPQEGVVRGHYPKFTPAQFKKSIGQLQTGVLAPVVLEDLQRSAPWTIADVATGWGVVCALRAFYAARGQSLRGQRVIIEGFGAVGGFTAYYLRELGAKIVGISSAGGGADKRGIRVAIDPEGLDVLELLRQREGTSLPPESVNPAVQDSQGGYRLFYHEADIFVPAALSHTMGLQTLDQLAACGVKVIAPGANNPFRITFPRAGEADVSSAPGAARAGELLSLEQMVDNMLLRMRAADERFAIVPDFIANSGMARTFAYLMKPGVKVNQSAILRDIRVSIERAVKALTSGLKGAALEHGLLERAYEMFLD